MPLIKACKGTMYYLPLPLEKTLKTIDEVHNNKSGEGLAGLPNPNFTSLSMASLQRIRSCGSQS